MFGVGVYKLEVYIFPDYEDVCLVFLIFVRFRGGATALKTEGLGKQTGCFVVAVTLYNQMTNLVAKVFK